MRNFVTLMCPHLAAKHIGVYPEEEIGSLRLLIQIAKRFDSLNARVPPTNDHFKRHSITYE